MRWSWGAGRPTPGKEKGRYVSGLACFGSGNAPKKARAYRSVTDNVEFEVLHQFVGVGLLEEEVLLLLWQPTDGCVCGPEERDGFVNGIIDQPKQVVFLQHRRGYWGGRLMLCPK